MKLADVRQQPAESTGLIQGTTVTGVSEHSRLGMKVYRECTESQQGLIRTWSEIDVERKEGGRVPCASKPRSWKAEMGRLEA